MESQSQTRLSDFHFHPEEKTWVTDLHPNQELSSWLISHQMASPITLPRSEGKQKLLLGDFRTILKKKKCKKAKWLSDRVLQIAKERRDAKGKGERERYVIECSV